MNHAHHTHHNTGSDLSSLHHKAENSSVPTSAVPTLLGDGHWPTSTALDKDNTLHTNPAQDTGIAAALYSADTGPYLVRNVPDTAATKTRAGPSARQLVEELIASLEALAKHSTQPSGTGDTNKLPPGYGSTPEYLVV